MPAKPVFIVGRHRSGTTALWNIFRQSDKSFCIYEPLNDRLPEFLRYNNSHADSTHLGVTDEFAELRPHLGFIEPIHRMDFAVDRLALSGSENHTALKDYLRKILSLTGNKTPVIKDVYIDYRLPWLKRNFANGVFLYIFRNPRDQWTSIVEREDLKFAGERWLSGFQLNTFAANMMFYLPEIMLASAQSSYERSYYLWCISKALGEKYADECINFDEEFLERDPSLFGRIAGLTGVPVDNSDVERLVQRVPTERWQKYAEQVPFDEIERKCQAVLASRGLLAAIREGAMDKAWPLALEIPPASIREAVYCLSQAFCREGYRWPSLTHQLATAEADARKSDAVSKSLNAKLETSDAKLRAAEANLQASEAKLGAALGESEALRLIGSKSQQALQEAGTLRQDLLIELNQVQGTLQASKSEIDSLLSELHRIGGQRDDLNARLHDLEPQLHETRSELQRVQGELAQAVAARQQALRELAEVLNRPPSTPQVVPDSNARTAFEGNADELVKRLAELTKENERRMAHRDRDNERWQIIVAKYSQLESQLQEAREIVAAYEEEHRTFSAQIGRWLGRQRRRWAPSGSRRSRVLGWGVRMIRRSHHLLRGH